MGFQCGIVGLPNVGKSTLFNALTQTAAAQAANYPFCTIEPNIGRVSVPDPRLEALSKIAKSLKIIPTQLEFVDIAGLVKGASKGEGLGNQFLGNIREVDAIVHVLRCFEDDNITHVAGTVDPLRDAEIIETELMLADLESLEKRHANLLKKAREDKEAKALLTLIEQILPALREGDPVRKVTNSDTDPKLFKSLSLLSSKPVLYVCNVGEGAASQGNFYTQKVKEFAQKEGHQSVIISASIEAEIASLEKDDDKKLFLQELGLKETGLSQVVHSGYQLLDLITFFTVGPKETRAWTVPKNTGAAQAAGVIHTDFERGFITAETISYEDYITYAGEAGVKAAGKMRLEGKEYVVQDGDIFHFRFNV